MNGLMVILIYIVSGIFGFAGGIFGYFFAKHKDKKTKTDGTYGYL